MNNVIKMISALTLVSTLFTTQIVYAEEENKNPLFVTITTETCYSCKKLKPVLEELEYEYYGKVNFITLDVTNRYALEEAKQTAEMKGISKYFEENKNAVPRVGILCPGNLKIGNLFTGEVRKEIYEEALNKLLTDKSTICSL